jgi:hypothetical protein
VFGGAAVEVFGEKSAGGGVIRRGCAPSKVLNLIHAQKPTVAAC